MQKSFSKAKKGYDTKEVDLFVKETEDTIIKQKERIFLLVKEAEETQAELKAYKGRQDLIVKSIMNAIAKAEQIEKMTKQKYQSDMARLKSFHERWVGYYNKLLQKYPLDAELNALSAFNQNMSKILTNKPDMQQMSQAEELFIEESQRLKAAKKTTLAVLPTTDDEPAFNPEASIRQMFRRQIEDEERKKQSPSGAKKSDSKTDKSKKSKTKNDKNQDDDTKISKTKSVSNYDESIRDFMPPTVDDDDSFSYEEALNPTQELSEILRDLGLELKKE